MQSAIKSGRFAFPDPQWSRVSPAAKSLVSALLTVDPAKRMTIEQAEVHPWMTMGSRGSKRKEVPGGAELTSSAEKRRTPQTAVRPSPPTFDAPR